MLSGSFPYFPLSLLCFLTDPALGHKDVASLKKTSPKPMCGRERKEDAQSVTPSKLGQLSLKTEGQFNPLSLEVVRVTAL